MRFKATDGFSLIELMVVVVIVAILARLVVPSYTNYIQRGNITEAIAGLSQLRLEAERFYADNRTYVGFSCTAPVAQSFTFSCVTPAAPTATTITITATGIANTNMQGFVYTINQNGDRATTFNNVNGWTAHNPNNCWVTRQGGLC